jgi:hypothetical protein
VPFRRKINDITVINIDEPMQQQSGVVGKVRVLFAFTLSLGLLLGCVPESAQDAREPATPSASSIPQSGGGTPCAPAIPARGSRTATLTELPHEIGVVTLFGLDGSFVASAYGYPLGASWRWWELDIDGTLIRRFEWRWQGAMLQSPDGSKIVYGAPTDNTSGRTALWIRDLNGPGRLLAPIDGSLLGWLDQDRVLVQPFDGAGVIHLVDTRTGGDQVVFTPPPPPTVKADSEIDIFDLSGDLRWAVFMRYAAGSLVRQDLFDVTRQSYVPGANLGTRAIALAPVGDTALWLDGNEVRAMHLCDRRIVTIGTLATSSDLRTLRWSADGRFASLSFGATSEQSGPERVVFVDLQEGAIAEIEKPWGDVRQWSPDGRYVLLNRAGFHGPAAKLAKFEFH